MARFESLPDELLIQIFSYVLEPLVSRARTTGGPVDVKSPLLMNKFFYRVTEPLCVEVRQAQAKLVVESYGQFENFFHYLNMQIGNRTETRNVWLKKSTSIFKNPSFDPFPLLRALQYAKDDELKPFSIVLHLEHLLKPKFVLSPSETKSITLARMSIFSNTFLDEEADGEVPDDVDLRRKPHPRMRVLQNPTVVADAPDGGPHGLLSNSSEPNSAKIVWLDKTLLEFPWKYGYIFKDRYIALVGTDALGETVLFVSEDSMAYYRT
ncbi:hypothetical protein HDV00_000264 [Rhizophlyctis rosea]|nr:hypothetical protein HDV00_000264 [Rhizophlyctis rosea]